MPNRSIHNITVESLYCDGALDVEILKNSVSSHAISLIIQELRPLTKNVTKLVFAGPKVDIEFQPKEGDQFKYLTYLCFGGNYSSHRITAVLRYCPKNRRLRLGIFDDCNHIVSFFRPVLNRQFLSNNFRRSGRANINASPSSSVSLLITMTIATTMTITKMDSYLLKVFTVDNV
ncbi:hypothetical protein BDC45DRAFT_610573 [Circinella umbellata]|nr:hypothetical protein BDC45DRAFT_610573 [Circinella umbellata]